MDAREQGPTAREAAPFAVALFLLGPQYKGPFKWPRPPAPGNGPRPLPPLESRLQHPGFGPGSQTPAPAPGPSPGPGLRPRTPAPKHRSLTPGPGARPRTLTPGAGG